MLALSKNKDITQIHIIIKLSNTQQNSVHHHHVNITNNQINPKDKIK
jgi:hypothetical protein